MHTNTYLHVELPQEKKIVYTIWSCSNMIEYNRYWITVLCAARKPLSFSTDSLLQWPNNIIFIIIILCTLILLLFIIIIYILLEYIYSVLYVRVYWRRFPFRMRSMYDEWIFHPTGRRIPRLRGIDRCCGGTVALIIS